VEAVESERDGGVDVGVDGQPRRYLSKRYGGTLPGVEMRLLCSGEDEMGLVYMLRGEILDSECIRQ